VAYVKPERDDSIAQAENFQHTKDANVPKWGAAPSIWAHRRRRARYVT